MSTKPDEPRLSERWIERIFARLLVRYGTPFLRKWDGLDLDLVKADWARRLAPYADNAAALIYGLDHLPEFPPTVDQFAEICRRGPKRPQPKQLQAPLAAAETRTKILAQVQAAIKPLAATGQWPRDTELQRLLDRQASGQRMTQYHRDRLRELQQAQARSQETEL